MSSRFSEVVKLIVAASAMAFASLLVLFPVFLFISGVDEADKVWRQPWPAIAWLVSAGICAMWFKSKGAARR
jgi:hypothetical protein